MNIKNINYSAAYSFSDAAISAVHNPSEIGVGDIIADFFYFRTPSFLEQIHNPNKYTLLHTFISNVNGFGIQYYLGKVDGEVIISDYGALLDGASIPRPIWFTEQDVGDHISKLRKIMEAATGIITQAAFQLLFSDRTFLYEFSLFIQPFISRLQPNEHLCIASPGVIKRPYLPVWLKNAVFHRDKGRCQLCGYDLTNILVPTAARHIDHMVPLNASGTNDPTNFQLTCESCNTSKGAIVLAKPHYTYSYW